MYGYIRPEIGELRVNEYRRFRSAYCGLCEALRRDYGSFARFLISYDMTFLATLTLPADASLEERRCPVHPFRKQPCVCPCKAMSDAAAFTVILAYWKMRDDAADEKGFRALRGRIAARLLRRYYKKAAARKPLLDKNTRECLEHLSALERSSSVSLDAAADCFAQLLAFPSTEISDITERRICAEILYHMGRAVYVLDAADDYSADKRDRRFNPLCLRYSGDTMTPGEKDEVRAALNMSLARAMNALALLPDGAWKPILENTISLGVPETADAVFAGTWSKKRKKEDL